MRVTDVRDVPFGEWPRTVLALREEGYVYFDWIARVTPPGSTSCVTCSTRARPGR